MSIQPQESLQADTQQNDRSMRFILEYLKAGSFYSQGKINRRVFDHFQASRTAFGSRAQHFLSQNPAHLLAQFKCQPYELEDIQIAAAIANDLLEDVNEVSADIDKILLEHSKQYPIHFSADEIKLQIKKSYAFKVISVMFGQIKEPKRMVLDALFNRVMDDFDPSPAKIFSFIIEKIKTELEQDVAEILRRDKDEEPSFERLQRFNAILNHKTFRLLTQDTANGVVLNAIKQAELGEKYLALTASYLAENFAALVRSQTLKGTNVAGNKQHTHTLSFNHKVNAWELAASGHFNFEIISDKHPLYPLLKTHSIPPEEKVNHYLQAQCQQDLEKIEEFLAMLLNRSEDIVAKSPQIKTNAAGLKVAKFSLFSKKQNSSEFFKTENSKLKEEIIKLKDENLALKNKLKVLEYKEGIQKHFNAKFKFGEDFSNAWQLQSFILYRVALENFNHVKIKRCNAEYYNELNNIFSNFETVVNFATTYVSRSTQLILPAYQEEIDKGVRCWSNEFKAKSLGCILGILKEIFKSETDTLYSHQDKIKECFIGQINYWIACLEERISGIHLDLMCVGQFAEAFLNHHRINLGQLGKKGFSLDYGLLPKGVVFLKTRQDTSESDSEEEDCAQLRMNDHRNS